MLLEVSRISLPFLCVDRHDAGWYSHRYGGPGRVEQSVGHLTLSQRSWVRYPVWPHTFFSPSADSRGAVVSYWRKYVHEVLVNRLPSKHGQMGPIWVESGHSAQIGPIWVRYWNLSPCETIIGPLLVNLVSTHILFCPGDWTMFIKDIICFISR